LTVLVSDELGAVKPARAAFDALVAALGVTARTRFGTSGDQPGPATSRARSPPA